MLHGGLSLYQKLIFAKFAQERYGQQLNNGYFFYPAFLINAWYKFGLLPENMWVGGSGAADYVFADNGVMEQNLLQHIAATKVKTTGTYELDTLYSFFSKKSSIAQKVRQKYKIDPVHTLSLFSAIPNAEHSVLDKQSAFEEFRKIVAILTSTAAKTTLLIALHRKMYTNEKIYKEIAQEYEAIIVQESLIEVISVADIYIASAASSTLFWGILCGVKTISLDLWHLQNDLFASSSSIQKVCSFEKLQEAFGYMLNNEPSLEADSDKLKREEIFDGRGLQRQAKFILSQP